MKTKSIFRKVLLFYFFPLATGLYSQPMIGQVVNGANRIAKADNRPQNILLDKGTNLSQRLDQNSVAVEQALNDEFFSYLGQSTIHHVDVTHEKQSRFLDGVAKQVKGGESSFCLCHV